MLFLTKPVKYICYLGQKCVYHPVTTDLLRYPPYAILPAFQAICEGMLLLGCIKEVSDYELVVSLPNGLSGFVPVTQISDAYSKMLSEEVAQGELLEVRLCAVAVICA